MVGVAGVVIWMGYAVFAYGWSQVRGCNAGFLNMINPFAAQPQCSPDTGGVNLTKGTGQISPSGNANIPSPGSVNVIPPPTGPLAHTTPSGITAPYPAH